MLLISYPFYVAFLSSIIHVMSGPDHLAAVTPLVLEHRSSSSWKIGLYWGIGHLLGMIIIGILFIVFRESIPIEFISAYSEQLVGIVLVFMGFWVWYKIFKETKKHTPLHVHFSQKNTYVHIHKYKKENTTQNEHTHHHINTKKKNSFLSSFFIGVLHGLAGVSHFILLLPILGLETLKDNIQYFIGFSIGTIFIMSAYALLLSKVSYLIKKEKYMTIFFLGIRFIGGLFAFVIGIYWIYASS